MKITKKKVIFTISIIIIFILGFILFHLYDVLIYRKTVEPITTLTETNTDSALYSLDEIKKIMKKYSKIFTEEQLQTLLQEKEFGTYTIPGLKATKTLDDKLTTMCTSMTPQGLAVNENYIFISAYCHTHRHNSVIYVLDRISHKYIKSIILPDKSHVGGLAIDPVNNNLWISGSNGKTSYANSYSMDTIKNYLNNKSKKTYKLKYDKEVPIYYITHDSFMNYINGYLIIGFFSTNNSSIIEFFKIDDDGNLHLEKIKGNEQNVLKVTTDYIATPVIFGLIPGEVQGLTAIDNKYLAISQSFGSNSSSLKVFKHDFVKNKDCDFTNNHIFKEYSLPNKLEQITVYKGKLYFLFEAGAYAYRGTYNTNVDRVLSVNIKLK